MFKRIIRKAFWKAGYRITRIKDAIPNEDPFEEMQRLCQVANPVIFDVGAYHGEISRHFRRILPKAKVYAFEPFAESYRRLSENSYSDPLIQSFEFGFSDEKGEQLFSSNRDSGTNSLLETDKRGQDVWGTGILETKERLPVNFNTIDLFMEQSNIQRIDILKMDVQGAEHLVMQGAEKAIASSKIGLIYTEIITLPTYRNQKQFYEIIKQFGDYGFRLHNIYNMSNTNDGVLRQIDAIFIFDPSE